MFTHQKNVKKEDVVFVLETYNTIKILTWFYNFTRIFSSGPISVFSGWFSLHSRVTAKL